jgi:hypothetical protein
MHIAARTISTKSCRPSGACHSGRVKAFDSYLFVLPNGGGTHGAHPDRLRSAAELHCYEGWLLGCRERPAADPRPRRRVVVVTPLGIVGAPIGTLTGALAAAGARHGCTYLISALHGATER